MVNISNNNKTDDKIEDDGFIFISQIETRVSTPISRKRSRIAYISSSSDKEAAIDTNADKDAD